MKANSLSISVPYKGCNKKKTDVCYNCCISKITGFVENSNFNNMVFRSRKVVKFAEMAGVTSVIVTGKGEPSLNMEAVSYFGSVFSSFPLELQTNGLFLIKNLDTVDELAFSYDTIAISIDDIEKIQEFSQVFQRIHKNGMTSRITVLLHDKNLIDPETFIRYCKTFGIDQISFRKITIPNNVQITKEKIEHIKWIEKNVTEDHVDTFLDYLRELIENKGHLVRKLPFGATLYNVDGISVTYFDYCIQDDSGDEDIRSLIFHEDGHLSTSWEGSNVGRIL